MSLIDQLSARLPFLGKPQGSEYFFALNIGAEKLTLGVWAIAADNLEILNTASSSYNPQDDIIRIVDRLIDQALGDSKIEPEKILFGVPDSWLVEEDLKEPHQKLLGQLVKDLEIKPMAYVATSHALAHFLEKQEGAPPTAILANIEGSHVTVSVMRAGKVDGSRVISRGESLGVDIEKALLSFTSIEVLPSRILIFGSGDLDRYRSHLLSYSWMNQLSFLHFPKIEVLENDLEIKAVCLAGAVEINNNIKLVAGVPIPVAPKEAAANVSTEPASNLGFVAGDVLQQPQERQTATPTDSVVMNPQVSAEEMPPAFAGAADSLMDKITSRFTFLNNLSVNFFHGGPRNKKMLVMIPLAVLLLLVLGYFFLARAKISVYVEPQILERDTQVTVDPSIKQVDEQNKEIPGQSVETTVSGSDTASATGQKTVGDPAKGTVTIRNKTNDSITVASGTTLTSDGGLKFTLDSPVTIASASATDGTWGKADGSVTAVAIGPDSNLPSQTSLSVGGYNDSQLVSFAQGNFSGGTSKQVTVVSEDDQKKLLASLAGTLRGKAQQSLQEKYPDKKILEDALVETITSKSFSKNVNDQASNFSLNLSVKYTGTAYNEGDLKSIVSKLVSTNIPDGFELDLAETETQADVSKVEDDGKVIFLARFRAKLIPKIDTQNLKQQIRGRSVAQAIETIKADENILGADINLVPPLPGFLGRLPLLDQNIQIEVDLK